MPGARWWAGKDPQLLRDAVDNVVAAIDIKNMLQPEVWAMTKRLTKRQRAARVSRRRRIRTVVLNLLRASNRSAAMRISPREINWLLRYGGLRSL